MSISQKELDKLKGLSGVEFDLPFNDQTYASLVSLVGKPNSRGRFAGVYIFKHLNTGSMYVGSSNGLGRRLSQYFNTEKNYFNSKVGGLLLPLIERDGISAFSLKVIVLPTESAREGKFYLMLEQYYLLDPRFTLNTKRIVNLREKQGNVIYIYNKDFTMLYHIGLSYAGLSREIGINQSRIKTSLDTGELYLGYFANVTEPQIGADKSNMTLQELNNFIEEKRKRLSLKIELHLYIYTIRTQLFYIIPPLHRVLYNQIWV